MIIHCTTLEQIKDVIINQNATPLREIEEITPAGTDCRFCVFPQGDFAKMNKKIYCNDILDEMKKELKNG